MDCLDPLVVISQINFSNPRINPKIPGSVKDPKGSLKGNKNPREEPLTADNSLLILIQ
jgi:hypothetical protein